MCGIAGFTFDRERPAHEPGPGGLDATTALGRMVAALEHRGPDALTGRVADGVALGHSRLSIVDLAGGVQPMTDPATGVTVVFNGEIFNHVELRERLAGSYRFTTRSDTEVILAAFVDGGIDCVHDFNGQFAFAIHDPRDGSLWFARDRYGIRPLHYARHAEGLAFASEAKALFASGLVDAAIDPIALWETLHLWAPTDERSMFAGVRSLPPGSVAHRSVGGELTIRRYWDFDLADERVDRSLSETDALDELASLLHDAVRLRLRADVPVAAYLSGGIDSSLLCALAQEQLGGTLHTFSIGFTDDRYDERGFQDEVATALGTRHRSILMDDADIGTLLPRVVEHSEAVSLRSAPAPLLKLSGLVRSDRTKVVLTGEGADEVFGGYDLFKEVKIREFWARDPRSEWRPALLGRLYPYLTIGRQGDRLVREFYGVGLDELDAVDFSHRIRWTNSGRISRFLSGDTLASVGGHDHVAALEASLPADVRAMRPLARAQYLEVRTLLSQYLLSTQGDRMLMANSVEGRFPFLDHRLADLSARLPDHLKLRGLTEKYLVKKHARGRVPAAVVDRHKFPYRAPIAAALTGADAPDWCRDLLSRAAVDEFGLFDGSKVERLVAKLAGGRPPSEADNMALMAVATTQLLSHRYVGDGAAHLELDTEAVAIEVLEPAGGAA